MGKDKKVFVASSSPLPWPSLGPEALTARGSGTVWGGKETEGAGRAAKSVRKQFGGLPPKYNFSLNPYPELRFSKCPDCHNKTGQCKLHLLIHVDPQNLIALNYTNRYCEHCDMLIGHKHEIEHFLTEMFLKIDPEVIGNSYLIFGTVEKKAWRENIKKPKPLDEMRQYVNDFKSCQNLRLTMTGWFRKGQEPPEMEPQPPAEWVKR